MIKVLWIIDLSLHLNQSHTAQSIVKVPPLRFASLLSGLIVPKNPAPNPLKHAFHYDRERLTPWERGRSLGPGPPLTLVATGLGNLRQCSRILPRAPNGFLFPTGLGSKMPRLGPKRWRPGKRHQRCASTPHYRVSGDLLPCPSS